MKKDEKIQEIYTFDKKYPEQLKIIKNYPEKLYVNGNVDILNKSSIAIIGSRRYSEYGMKMAKKFTKELVEAGFAIVSGMACGIDFFAHEECINSGGKTIAVIASGFNKIYPEENKKLYKKILNSNGCIITEYSPDTEVNNKNFPIRNRLISGLAIGTLVIEAGYRSGTNITARFCKEQNRKLFCIPNSLESKNSIGVNNLIKNGANLVTSANDIIKEFENIKNRVKIEKTNYNFFDEYSKNISQLSKKEFEVYNCINKKSRNADEISDITKLEISKVNEILSILEIEEYIVKVSNNRYMVNNNEL